MGNPPFRGARIMDKIQKEDVQKIFSGWKDVGNLDYVSCWFKRASDFMNNTSIRCAFVSTNSICQGEQVAPLWKPLFAAGIKINFAYKTFIWNSESNQKAHVHCVIIGFSYKSSESCSLFDGNQLKKVDFINAYLNNAPSVFIDNRSHPLCNVPEARSGNKPIDNGNYLFSKEEMLEFIKEEPGSKKYFHPWYGSVEFIHRKPRYCLYLGNCPIGELLKMPYCLKRVEAVREYRLNSTSPGTKKLADKPTHFHVETILTKDFLILPLTSSQNRRYVPIGFMDKNTLASNLVIVVPNASLYHFGGRIYNLSATKIFL